MVLTGRTQVLFPGRDSDPSLRPSRHGEAVLSQWLQRDFFEEDNVLIAVILQTDEAFRRPQAPFRLVGGFLRRYFLTLAIVGDLYIIHHDNGARAVQGNEHGVPFWPGLAWTSESLGQRVQHSGDVIVIRIIVDLHLIAVVHWHPRFARLDGDADKHTGIVVLIAHFVGDTNATIATLSSGPIQQAHAAVCPDQTVFDGHFSRAHVLPAGQISAIEQLLPGIGS